MSGDFLKSDSVTLANRNGRDKWLSAARNAYQRVVAALSMIFSENRRPFFRIML
jgi:hypothetical protein